MKNKLSYYSKNFVSYANSEKFRLILLLILGINIYGVFFATNANNYFDSFLGIFMNSYYIMMILFLFLYNTIQIYHIYEKNKFYILRLGTYKNNIKNLLFQVVFANTIIFIILIVINIIGLNLIQGNTFGSGTEFEFNGISNILYLLFYLCKIYCLIMLITSISVLLFKLIENKIVIFLNIILYISIPTIAYIPNTISNIFDIPLLINKYFSILPYNSFSLEIQCLVLYLLFLFLITAILFKIVENSRKDISI